MVDHLVPIPDTNLVTKQVSIRLLKWLMVWLLIGAAVC